MSLSPNANDVADAEAFSSRADRAERPSTFIARLGLIAASIVLITAAHEPFGLFPAAWVGLVPLLLATYSLRPLGKAGVWFVFGVIFYSLNMHWIWHTTILGAGVLMVYLSVFMALTGLFAPSSRGLGEGGGVGRSFVKEIRFVLVFVAIDWLRGWLFTGMPWGMLAHSQSLPAPILCQVADFGGESAVTLWVVAINLCVAAAIVRRRTPRDALRPLGFAAGLMASVVAYGAYQLHETARVTRPGMRVMVVQSAFPHERGGAKTVTFEQQITFHFDTTDRALSDSGRVDLVAWGETVLPAMNDEAIARSNNPELSTRLRERLIEFTRRHDVSLIFGAYALLSFPKNPRDADVRNSTYLLSPGATVMPRYDKIHLVPFGEIVPFRHSIPWMHELFFRMAAYSVSYLITPGSIENLAPFRLPAGSCVVTPICFEDVDAWLIRQMIAPRGDQQKRAELILNITNDGWFSGAQHRQHLAMAALRSIENRVWTARACNMGISAFIDSSGRVVELLPTGRIGVLVRQTEIDPRLTPYTRLGDVLAIACFLGFVPIGRLRRALRKAVA